MALGAVVCGVCLFPGIMFARIGAYDFACLYGVCGATIAAVFVSMVIDRGGPVADPGRTTAGPRAED